MKSTMFGVYKDNEGYGAVYREDLPIPAYGDRGILVKVRAAAICGTDHHIIGWTGYAQSRCRLPMVFGHEFSGDVVAVGGKVTEVCVGDRVACETHIPCNNCYMCATGNRHICENMKLVGVHTQGAFAEFASFPADCAYKLDDSLDYETGAALEPMGVAVHGVKAADVRGKTVAIYGCGAIGLMAVGAARACGAAKIFAVDQFDAKLAAGLNMGADIVIDARGGKASEKILEATGGRGADAVIDYTGSQPAIRDCFSALRKGGVFVMVGLPDSDLLLPATDGIIYKEATVIGITGRLMYETWDQCAEILKSPLFHMEHAVGGRYALRDFEKAFEAIRGGAPGKMLLIP